MRTRHMVLSAALGIAMAFSAAAQAVSTFRVGSQVLTAGDSDARVIELLGEPAHKSRSHRARRPRTSSRARSRRVVVLTKDGIGEKWQYRRDGHVTTVTIVDGKVSDIEDHRI